MNKVYKTIFGSENLATVLSEDASAIKKIANDVRAYSYQEQNDDGYVTAKSFPVPASSPTEKTSA